MNEKEERWYEKMKVAVKIKGKTELTYIDTNDIIIGNITLGELLKKVEALRGAYDALTGVLKDATIISRGDLVEVNGTVQKVDSVQVFADDTKVPFEYLKVERGKLVIDKKKVGAIL